MTNAAMALEKKRRANACSSCHAVDRDGGWRFGTSTPCIGLRLRGGRMEGLPTFEYHTVLRDTALPMATQVFSDSCSVNDASRKGERLIKPARSFCRNTQYPCITPVFRHAL